MIDTAFLMWTVIVGFFSPILIAFIQQEPWSDRLRALVMFLACVALGLGNCFFQGKLNLENRDSIIISVLLVVVTAISSYKGLWQPTNVAPKIEHISSGTHVDEFHQNMALRAA